MAAFQAAAPLPQRPAQTNPFSPAQRGGRCRGRMRGRCWYQRKRHLAWLLFRRRRSAEDSGTPHPPAAPSALKIGWVGGHTDTEVTRFVTETWTTVVSLGGPWESGRG